METLGKRTIRLGITVGLSLGAIVGVVGCGETSDDIEGTHESAVETANGLNGINGLNGVNGLYAANGINGLNGLNAANGLTGANGLMGGNGLSAANGLQGLNGLAAANGLMTTDAGRKTVAYLAKCALASGDSLVKQDQYGVQFTFNGGLNLCPAWKTGSIASNRNCQNLLSACLMAHINTSGVHVPLWIDSEDPKVGWGTNANYPNQEGTFFGSMIMTGNLANLGMPQVNAPVAYFCEGAGISAGAVSGRLGVGQTSGIPYTNPFGTNVTCKSKEGGAMLAGPYSPGKTAPDGYKTATTSNYVFQNGETLTVWRNPNYTPTFDAAYRYSLVPTSATGRSMNIASDGTTIQQWDMPNGVPGDNDKFAIASSGSNWKIVLKKDTSKCVGAKDKGTGNGTQMKVQACDGSTNQAFSITADANNGSFQVKHVASGRCLDVAWGNDPAKNVNGNAFQIYDCWNGINQRFNVKSSY